MTDQPYPGPGPVPPQGPVPVPGVPGYPAVPRPDMSFPHPVPTPYQRMLRTWTYEWWKPVVGILLVIVGFFVVTSMVYIVVAGVVAAFRSGSWLDNFMASSDLSNVRPETLFALNLGLGSMILVTWFVVRVLHGLRPRWLTSVVPRMRWKFFVVCLGLSVIALAAQIAVGSVLPGDAGGGVGGKVNDFTTSTALAALVVLLTTPLQALGSLFSNRWVAIGATGILFALAHGVQNFPLFFDRLSFGLIAAWLVVRTGGLEAGIALHVLNNFLAFGLALSYGDLSETLNVTEASWWNIVLTVTQSAVYAVLVLYVARRMGLQTRTRPPSTQPGPASTGTVDGSLTTA